MSLMLRKIYKAIVPFFIVLIGLSIAAKAQDTVVIIRHGEKPAKGDNLNCKGLNRSIALPKVLAGKFSIPNYVYACKLETGKATKHSRMFQTITPFAARYNLVINTSIEKTDSAKVGREIPSRLTKKHGTIVMVWEHHNIPVIARALGVPRAKVPDWADDDYDSIWIITHAGTKKAELSISSEGLNGVSVDCP